MRINHNLTAINTHRQMGISELDGSKSMEKLSSGFRINRAGDDAAGLAISEKMRGQVRGLSMASKNSSDTISLIQTAEGALAETHSILQRMRELSVQSANDTNTDKDREELQAEVTQLKAEIDRIGNTTEFNTKKLLEGSATGVRDAIVGTQRINNNSSVVIDANKDKAMAASIGEDRSWAFDGAYMLVKVNQTVDANNNRVFKAEDYNLVGPDGNVFKFKTYTPDTIIKASGLEAGTIIAEGGETRRLAGTAGDAVSAMVNWPTELTGTPPVVTPLNEVIIGAALTEKELSAVAKDSILTSGSSFTFKAVGSTLTLGDAGLGWGDGYGIDTITLALGDVIEISDSKDATSPLRGRIEVGQTITLNDGTVLKNNGGGKVSVENGSLTIGTDGLVTDTSSGGGTANVTSFTLAAQSTLNGDSETRKDSLELVVASNLFIDDSSIGTLTKNVTIGNSSGFVYGQVSKLAAGSVLAKGSMLNTDGTTDWSLKIEVKGKEVEIKFDSSTKVLTVGGEMVAAGKSITLEDGSVITHKANLIEPNTATGNIFIEHGSVKLAEDIAKSTTTPAVATELGDLITDMRIAKDSTLVAGSDIANRGRLMAGTVITNGDPEKSFSGSITMANGGTNFQFSANTGNALETRYYDLKVQDSMTFIFTNYDAASSNLNDSIMSQIGANSGQTTFLSINDMRCKALGVSDVDISTKWGAATAIETVNNALQKVSHQRALMGAQQNRLEHTIKNLDTSAENLQAAESRIRDVDMAKEVMEFTRTNILQQASQAMLAQANQQPQSVLQLLR